MKKVSKGKKMIYLPLKLIKETQVLILHTRDDNNFSLYVEDAIREKNERGKS